LGKEAEATSSMRAAAMEMIHTSSLVLDDLPSMDDAMVRRGAPALHRQFGRGPGHPDGVAFAQSRYGLIAANHRAAHPRPVTAHDVVQRVVDAVGWTEAWPASPATCTAKVDARLRPRWSSFIRARPASCSLRPRRSGRCSRTRNAATLHRIEIYAKNLGLAFSDHGRRPRCTSNVAQLGKDVGKDAQRLTFVKLAGVDGARKLTAELVDTSLAALAPMRAAADPLRALAVMVRDRVK